MKNYRKVFISGLPTLKHLVNLIIIINYCLIYGRMICQYLMMNEDIVKFIFF